VRSHAARALKHARPPALACGPRAVAVGVVAAWVVGLVVASGAAGAATTTTTSVSSSTTTSVTSSTTTSTTSSTTTIPASAAMFQQIATLSVELSACNAYAMLRTERVQQAESRCSRHPSAPCDKRVARLRQLIDSELVACERRAVAEAPLATASDVCALQNFFGSLRASDSLLCGNPALVADVAPAAACESACGKTNACPRSRDYVRAAAVLAETVSVECPAKAFVQIGRYASDLATCYAATLDPFSGTTTALKDCLDRKPRTLKSGLSCADCVVADFPGHGNDTKRQITAIALNHLPQCLDATGEVLQCDDGDPCTADTCENGGCVHRPGPTVSCAPADNACRDDTCSGGKCVEHHKPNGTQFDPHNPCRACLEGRETDRLCATGCTCSVDDGGKCISLSTFQPCP